MRTSEVRPWGRWEEYLNEEGYRVKRLIISPGKRFSLQWHRLRSECWVAVQGSGILTHGAVEKRVCSGSTVTVAAGELHRLSNDTVDDLVVIEVQLGTCLEDDIVRVEDDWNRV